MHIPELSLLAQLKNYLNKESISLQELPDISNLKGTISNEDFINVILTIKNRLVNLYCSIRNDATDDNFNIRIKALRLHFDAARKSEIQIKDNISSLSALSTKRVYFPTLMSNSGPIDVLRTNKLITKQEINLIATKVSGFVEIPVRSQNQNHLAEFGILSPDLFALPNDGVFKSSPTYKVINSILKYFDLKDLSSLANRDLYLELPNNHEESILKLTNAKVTLSKRNIMLLNVINTVVLERFQTENNLTQKKDVELLIVLMSLISTLLQSCIAVVAVVAQHDKKIACFCMLSLPINKSEDIKNLIHEEAQSKFKLFSSIKPFKPLLQSGKDSESILSLDDYILEFASSVKNTDHQIAELSLLNPDTLKQIQQEFFVKLVSTFASKTSDESFKHLLDTLSDKSDKDSAFYEFCTTVIGWHKHLLKVDSISLNECFITDPKAVIVIKAALENIKKTKTINNTLNDLEKNLEEAVNEKDYTNIINTAKTLNEFGHDVVFSSFSDELLPAISYLMNNSNIDGNSLNITNTDTDTNTDAKQAVTTNKQIKQLEKNIRGLNNDVSRLTTALDESNNKLTAISSDKTNVLPTIEIKPTQTKPNEIEKKFLFGEKTSNIDAVNLIRQKFPHVIFADNIDVQIANCNYKGSQKLLKFLWLLVNDYFGAITSGTPDSEAKHILGQTYRANESESVLNESRLRRQREQVIEGKKKLFTKHINIASARDSRNSCSIYFDITNGNMTIGYIGVHLDNSLT